MGMVRARWMLALLLAVFTIGCAASDEAVVATASPPPTASTAAPRPISTASPTIDLQPASWDTRVRRLAIPALGIDSEVSGSEVVLDTSLPPPGCPTPPPGQETLTVPAEGIATPEEAIEGLDNAAWIFGHSRWQNEPGLFHALQGIAVGDEILVDGEDRRSGARVTRQSFLVEGIYLTDKDSGAALVAAENPEVAPTVPTVILQTSVREAGADRQWLLDREQVLSRAENLVEGDLEDPCKYLLLFVIARASQG
jgi:hypothetical protein